eukprot:CAMPEP_0176296412 /NCGR_PEP_ID=MMETSP0121_2-20121125/58180_1 /TAXON_ID=160619 /ORGANISM="Kryptoperidinium foliaceum, Strain CCMP 1326" /LENGTH=188 /DNA_ID=CAMNT_0017637543 /DNA_START=49 /DNA_END=612 /DNA_ORIENTATION=-
MGKKRTIWPRATNGEIDADGRRGKRTQGRPPARDGAVVGQDECADAATAYLLPPRGSPAGPLRRRLPNAEFGDRVCGAVRAGRGQLADPKGRAGLDGGSSPAAVLLLQEAHPPALHLAEQQRALADRPAEAVRVARLARDRESLLPGVGLDVAAAAAPQADLGPGGGVDALRVLAAPADDLLVQVEAR